MLNDFFKKDSVVKFFKDITTGIVYQNKSIPITICDERIDSSYYPILMGFDAIIKYYIIIRDSDQFDEYLSQVQLLLRKVDNHQSIKLGIHKLLINCCQKKLGLKNLTDSQNKEEIIKYFYNQYIVNGYFFHSFPSVFLDDVTNHGLSVQNYFYELENIKEINQTIKKYYENPIFSKVMEPNNPYIAITDSPFMGAYYAYTTPFFLNELTSIESGQNQKCDITAFFKKDYASCKNNLTRFMKKQDISSLDMTKINTFFEREWDLFKVEQSIPVFCMIKRESLHNNSLQDIKEIMEEVDSCDISSSISKILESRFNYKNSYQDIPRPLFEIEYLPTLEELGMKDPIETKKQDETNSPKPIGEYGNTTIIALLGVLLITIGITIMLIMLGR